MAIDYATGVLLAICEKKVSSDIGFKGICNKVLIFTLVALGNIIDQYIIAGSSLRTMLIMFYLSNEGNQHTRKHRENGSAASTKAERRSTEKSRQF